MQCLLNSRILGLLGLLAMSQAIPPHSRSTQQRNGKWLGILSYVRFNNVECDSTMGDKGTCYTERECGERNGLTAGSCASGFGVCCMTMPTCGESTNLNNTYFINPKYPSPYNRIGQCMLTVQKMDMSICQLRLDFLDFELQQPNEVTHNCNKDRFIVSGGSPVPIVCGSNSGAHMYIDTLSGNSPITLTVVTNGEYTRLFKIHITQITCTDENKAWDGCLQFYNEVSGRLQSFNYNQAIGKQLSNQDYTICIKHQRGFCGISYQACTDDNGNRNFSESFTISGNDLSQVQGPGNSASGDQACSNDWISIPCATNVSLQANQIPGAEVDQCVDRFCGESFCPMSNDSTAADSECSLFSYARPFLVRVHFDQDETGDGPPYLNRGFCLDFVQQPCSS